MFVRLHASGSSRAGSTKTMPVSDKRSMRIRGTIGKYDQNGWMGTSSGTTALADFSVMKMVFHLMFPVLFFGCLGFALATIVRSGNGAAAVLVSIGLFLWILTEPLEGSRWNLFYNPFAQLEADEAMVQSQTTFYNRAYLLAGSGALLLLGLLRLQQRERYMQG